MLEFGCEVVMVAWSHILYKFCQHVIINIYRLFHVIGFI